MDIHPQRGALGRVSDDRLFGFEQLVAQRSDPGVRPLSLATDLIREHQHPGSEGMNRAQYRTIFESKEESHLVERRTTREEKTGSTRAMNIASIPCVLVVYADQP